MSRWIFLLILALTFVAGPSSADEAADLEQVVKSGSAKEQYTLGVRYIRGKGVYKDLAIAEKLLRVAAGQDHTLAMTNLGNVIQHRTTARKEFVEATKWFRAAAEKGMAEGQYHLGQSYQHGKGAPHNYASAAEWYGKAAAQELPKAINALAVLYRNGLGVEMDFAKAQELYRQAAKKGYSKAQYNLAIMTLKTAVTQSEYLTAAKLLQAAAARNHRAAQYQLAKMYEQGEGVPWDHSRACMWMKISAHNGFKRAKAGLPVLVDKMGADELKLGEPRLRHEGSHGTCVMALR